MSITSRKDAMHAIQTLANLPGEILNDACVAEGIRTLHRKLERPNTDPISPATTASNFSCSSQVAAGSYREIYRGVPKHPSRVRKQRLIQRSGVQSGKVNKRNARVVEVVEELEELEGLGESEPDCGQDELDYIRLKKVSIESRLGTLEQDIATVFLNLDCDILSHFVSLDRGSDGKDYARYSLAECCRRYEIWLKKGPERTSERRLEEYIRKLPENKQGNMRYALRCGGPFEFLEQKYPGLGMIVRKKLLKKGMPAVARFLKLAEEEEDRHAVTMAGRIPAGGVLFLRLLHERDRKMKRSVANVNQLPLYSSDELQSMGHTYVLGGSANDQSQSQPQYSAGSNLDCLLIPRCSAGSNLDSLLLDDGGLNFSSAQFNFVPGITTQQFELVPNERMF